jgi:hypothetical protein
MSTYPTEAWPTVGDIEALDGTSDLNTGLPYIPKGTGPTSSPSYEVQYNRRQHRLNRILAGWRQGMVVDEGGLAIGVYPMLFTIGGVRKSFSGATGVAISDNSTKVVYLDTSAALQTAAAWPGDPTTYMPLAVVTAVNGKLTIVDRRPDVVFHVPSVESSLVNDRRVVTAHVSSVGNSQSDVEVFAFDPAEDLTLEEVQVYCTAMTATASVDVKEGGASVLSTVVTPSAGAIVGPTISDGDISSGNHVTIHVTTDGGGSLSDLTVTLLFKAALAA